VIIHVFRLSKTGAFIISARSLHSKHFKETAYFDIAESYLRSWYSAN
jgi:hypothetical protein